MKDSGYSYIGNIPENWEVTRNKNVFSCAKELVGSKYNSTQLLSLTTKGVKEKDINNPEGKLPESFDTYQYVKENDIVMCLFDLDVSAVFSGISPFNGMISPAYRVLTCKNNIVPKFADYWFKYISDGRKFNHYAKNIRYTLNYEDFSSLPIVFPPLETQHRIADYLDDKCAKIDAIIEKQQAVIEKLKEYKLSVITEAVTPKSHWQAGHLGYLSSFKNGLNYNGASEEKEIKFLGVGDFKQHFLLNREDMFSTLKFNGEIPDDLLLKNGDIVFVRSNGSKELVGRSVLIDNVDYPLTYSGFCIRMRNLRKDLVSNEFLMYLFWSNDFRQCLNRDSRGSNINNLNQELLSKLRVVFPDLDEQKKIVDILSSKCAEIENIIIQKENIVEKLIDYKKSLIYEVVTGKKVV